MYPGTLYPKVYYQIFTKWIRGLYYLHIDVRTGYHSSIVNLMYAVDKLDTETTLLVTTFRIYEPNNTQSQDIGNVMQMLIDIVKIT